MVISGGVRHPIGRGLIGAWIGFTAATMLAGAAIGFVKKGDAAYRVAANVAIAAAVVGGAAGLLTRPSTRPTDMAATAEWTDWRDFEVVRKVQESAEITSFYLRPKDGGSLPSFLPGQFLTIKLDIPGQPRPVIRTYSLSDYAAAPVVYRLSIKREPAPKELDVPPGIASNFMHDHVHEGSIIPAKPPSGRFVLNVDQARPAVLISNGVGITPMVSMAKAVSTHHPARHVWFLHGARSGDFHALRADMEAITQQHPNLHLYYRYSRPNPDDEGKYHSTGYVDTAMLHELIIPEIQTIQGSSDADYFLCGSPAFMDSLREGLKNLGVPDSQVFFESFSKPKAAPGAIANSSPQPGTAEITFAHSGKTATWHPGDGTLLEFAEDQGLTPDYSCRQGICLTCMCAIKSGEVAYDEPPTGTPDPGSVLICISRPKTAVVVLDL